MASRPIDEKIVKLSLDNQSFKSNLKESIDNLKGLNTSMGDIKSDGLADATTKTTTMSSRIGELVSKIPVIGNIATAIMGIGKSSESTSQSVSTIGSSADIVSQKFSVLQGAASVVLGNLATKASMAGLNVAKSLTVQPIMDGYNEYVQKLSAIQVMKSNTTASMDEINGALASLNDYSDKTIYNFGDMTKAVGEMTTAGVDLSLSVTATTGAYNLAAASGMSAVQAQGMVSFGLTQAMTKGFLGVQDLVSFGTAGGKKFQDMAHQIADEMGVGYDKSKSFRDSLADGWLNTQVLTEAMKRFGEDPAMLEKAGQAHSFGEAMGAVSEAVGSGWGAVWEALIGNFDEATEVWTKFQNAASKAVQAPLKGIAELAKAFVNFGGRTAIIDAVVAVFKALQNVLGGISKAWTNAFPKTNETSGLLLASIFKVITAAIQIMLSPLQLVGPAFQIIFGVLRIGFDVVKMILTPLTTLIKIFTKGMDFSKSVSGLTDWSSAMEKTSAIINMVFKPIQGVFVKIDAVLATLTTNFVKNVGKIGGVFVNLKNSFVSFIKMIDGATGPVQLLMKAFTDGVGHITPLMAIIALIKESFILFGGVIEYVKLSINNLIKGFNAFFGAIKIVLEPLTKLKNHFVETNPIFAKWFTGISEVGNAAKGFTIKILQIIKHMSDLNSSLRNGGGAFADLDKKMKKAGEDFSKWLSDFANSIRNNPIVTAARQLGKDIIDGLTIGLSNKVLDLFGLIKPSLNRFINSIRDLFGIHSPSRVMMEIGKNIIDGLTLGISNALATFPQFFDKVSKVFDFAIKHLGGILGKIPSGFRIALDAIKNIVHMLEPYMDTLKTIFGAIGTIFGEFLNQINFSSVIKGGLIVSLIGWIKALGKSDGVSIISKLLHPLRTLKEFLSEKFGSGGGMLDQVQKTLKSYQNEIRTQSLVNISIAIGVLAGAMWILSTIPANKLLPAAIAMAAASAALAIVFKTMTGVSEGASTINVFKVTATVIGISIALAIMAKAMNSMSSMKPEQALVGVVAMGALMTMLSLTLSKGMQIDEGKSIVKIGSLLVVTLAISKLANVLVKLSKLSWNDMARGLTAMGVVMGMLSLVVQSMKINDTQSVVGFTGMALALNFAVLPVIALGLLPWDITARGLLAMTAVLISFAAINVIVSKFGGSKGSVGLVSLAMTLNMAVIPIVALGLIPWPVIAQGIVAMGATLLVLAGINVILNKFGGGGGSLALIGMALALQMIVPTIVTLGVLPWSVVSAGLIAMAAGLGILLVAALGAQLILPGVTALAGLLLAFSAASLSFGIGSMLVVTAIGILAGVIITQGVKIVKGLGNMLEAIGNLGPALGSAVGTLVGGLISGFAQAISSNIKSIISIGADLIRALVGGILSASDTLITGVVTLFNQLVSAIIAEIPIFAVKVGNGIIAAMNILAMFIENNTDAILSAVGRVMSAIVILISTALGDVLGAIPGVGDKLKEGVINAGKKAADGLKDTFPPGMNAATSKGAEAAIDGLRDKKSSMKEEALQLSMSAVDGASKLTTFMSLVGIQGGDQFVAGIKSGAIPAQNAGDLLNQMAKAGASNGTLTEIAASLGGTFADGVFTLDNKTKAEQAGNKLSGAAKDGTKPSGDQKAGVEENGKELAGGLVAGVESMFPKAQESGEGVSKYINTGLGKVTDHSGAGKATAGSKVTGVESTIPGMESSVGNLNSKLLVLGETTDYSEAGRATGASKGAGVAGSVGVMQNGVANVNSATDPLAWTPDFKPIGLAIGGSKGAGVAGSVGVMQNGVNTINNATNPLGQTPDFSGAGSAIGRSKGDGVSSAQGNMNSAVNGINRATDSLGETKDFSSSGSNMVGTLLGGIKSAWEGGKHIISNIGSWISDHLKTNSPAKKGALHDDWYGIVGTGAKIVTEFSKNMTKSMPKLADATINMTNFLSTSISDISDSVDTDFMNMSPTITPVIDYSNIDNLDFANFSKNITTDVTANMDYNAMNQNAQQIAQTNSVVNSLQRGFDKLSESVNDLSDVNYRQLAAIGAQSDMAVYLDRDKVGYTMTPVITDNQENASVLRDMMGGKRPNGN